MRRSLPISWSGVLSVLLIAFAFGGCGKSEPPPPPKVEDTVFADVVAAKERARLDAEKAMEANKKKLEEAMKRSEEGTKQ